MIFDMLRRLWRKGASVSAPGQRAIAEAQRLFDLDVYDPKKGDTSEHAARSLAVIQSIVNDAGWTWIKYDGDGATQWCGMFAAACWRKAGINPKYLATFWASTQRLDHWARGKHWNGKLADGPRPHVYLDDGAIPGDCRLNDGSLPKTGDVVIVGRDNWKTNGHIVLCESYDPTSGVFVTLGGNGVGVGPDGKKRQGIVRASFKVGGDYCVRVVLRPLPGDLV